MKGWQTRAPLAGHGHFSRLWRGAALAALLPVAAAQQAADGGALPGVTVRATAGAASGDSPLAPSAPRERRRLARIAGGTALALPQDEGRLTGLRDALGVQPGVIVQDLFGGFDAPRLNVRGSGLQSHPVNRGVTLLLDGLPLNDADGTYVSGLADPRNTAQISIRRGANARSPAGESLGGEMDFQSLTGYDGRGLARLQAGSFGRRAWQVALGAASAESGLDARVSFSGERYRGFRHHSDGQRKSVQANAGWHGAGGLESRLWLGWTDLGYRIAGPLPPGRAYGDPSQVLGDGNTPRDRLLNLYQRNPHRNARQWRAASRTSWGGERLRHELGLWWQHTDVQEQNMVRAALWSARTHGVQWQSFFTPSAAWRWRLAAAWERSDTGRDFHSIQPRTGALLQRFGSFDLMAENARASAGLDVDVAPGWTLTADLRITRSRRNAQSRTSAAAQRQSWRYATPKAGLIWRPRADLRLFANLSRSHEAPTFTDLVTGSVAANNPARAATALARLGMQRATTVEAGAEGRLGGPGQAWDARWQLALYRSAIRGELLRTADASGLQASTRNYAGGTRHQGLEAGMEGRLRLHGLPEGWPGGAFDWRAAWTWSDYRFRGGPLAGKRIAGAPRHFIQAELLWRAGGWRAGPTLLWQPLNEYVDHANTPGYAQRRYALLGLRAEYRRGPWHVQVRGENLTGRRYVSTFVVADRANPNINLFPGSGRSVTVSVSREF